MEAALRWPIMILFLVATFALAIYGLHLYVLVFLYKRRASSSRREQAETIQRYREHTPDDRWPVVTTQLPIYNESDVARRVIEAAAAMDYPVGRHEIQVLDDSTDHTRAIVDRTAAKLVESGIDVKVIRRPDRQGYKAGALAFGLETARGEYVAVFDADFTPSVDFLRKAAPLLENDSNLACIQGRWDHLNRSESWLTEAQALGIDGHFAIEQGARAWNGLMMNFNGTAGVWRKAAIDDPKVGGWSGDTLTEDLDLSYRAQLAGWRIDYCIDMPCPAELPGTITALKSQQRRWATGSIQVAAKLLPSIWRAKLSLAEKVEATLHLTHYSVAVWMLILALVARPMLGLAYDWDELWGPWFVALWGLIFFAAMAPSVTYTYARYTLGGGWAGLHTIPAMLTLGCGLCVSNGLAVLRGLYLKGGEFIRTPKSGSDRVESKNSSYQVAQNHLWAIELLLGAYVGVCFLLNYQSFHKIYSLFLLLYTMGFLVVGWTSSPWRVNSAAAPEPQEVPTVASPVSSVGSTGGG